MRTESYNICQSGDWKKKTTNAGEWAWNGGRSWERETRKQTRQLFSKTNTQTNKTNQHLCYVAWLLSRAERERETHVWHTSHQHHYPQHTEGGLQTKVTRGLKLEFYRRQFHLWNSSCQLCSQNSNAKFARWPFFLPNSRVILLVSVIVPVQSSTVSEENDQILLLALLLWEKETRKEEKETLVFWVNEIIKLPSNTFPCTGE